MGGYIPEPLFGYVYNKYGTPEPVLPKPVKKHV
jgi:hypothetical protein